MIEIFVDAGYYGRGMYASMHTFVWGYSVVVPVSLRMLLLLLFCGIGIISYILFVYVDFFFCIESENGGMSK